MSQPREALTSLPSVSKKSNCREMRYWVGATNCQMQFLLGGYSLGQPGLVMEPLSLVRNPPQAAGDTREVASPSREGDDGHKLWAGVPYGGAGGLGPFSPGHREGGMRWGTSDFRVPGAECVYGHFYFTQARASTEREWGG